MSDEAVSYRVTFNVGGREVHADVSAERAVLGRSPTCDIVIPEERVSRQHATILRENHEWTVFDMGSANGTFLNDRPIVKSILRSGDVISLGEVAIRFEDRTRGTTGPHRVVIEDQPARRNKTAVFNMAELSVISHISSISESRGASDKGQAATWAIALFSQAAQALLSSQDLDDVLDKVLELVFKNLPVERGVIALYEDDTIIPRITRARADIKTSETIRISETIAKEAIRLKQAILVGDARSDERFGAEESILKMNIFSAMCAPLYNEGRVSGLIYVDNRDPRNSLTEEQLKLLSAVGVFAAVALEQTRLREKVTREERIRERLAKYNSKAVVDQIVERALDASQNEMGGDMIAEEREVSIVFADLCGFTTLSENLAPHEIAQLLNGVFGQLTDAIFEFDGTLDKFMGDALMAFFGAPLVQPDHALRAVKAALVMKARLADFNADIGGGNEVAMRVGINSGSVVAGDIGSSERKDYTVIGDTVNIASRFESSVAKPGDIVIGPTTYEMVKHEIRCESLGPAHLKGKEKAVIAYRVIG